eukprot:TRINITY_DN3030_c0_g1_i1.p1 TRINITY_DN3030_c0_g1~~TRINITY_DN3030_c0_g1_i1.p1  ORF type:complete len:276 (-),score=68.09 TRINITY_DN3030_c0_g1_i1:34-861(-)
MKTYRIQGEWINQSAGGCFNHSTWRYNPQVFITVEKEIEIKIKLTQNSEKLYHIGFYIYVSDGTKRRQLVLSRKNLIEKAGFEDSRELINKVKLQPLEGSPSSPSPCYVLIPCTFAPGEETPFTLTLSSNDDFIVEPISADKEWHYVSESAEWGGKTAGGCLNYPTAKFNPQFLLQVKKVTEVNLILSQREKADFDQIGLYIFRTKDPSQKIAQLKPMDLVGKAEFESSKEALCSAKLDPSFYYRIIPCTFDPKMESHFVLTALCDLPVRLVLLE